MGVPIVSTIGIQISYILQKIYEPHLSDKACSEASRFSITKVWHAYFCVIFKWLFSKCTVDFLWF